MLLLLVGVLKIDSGMPQADKLVFLGWGYWALPPP